MVLYSTLEQCCEMSFDIDPTFTHEDMKNEEDEAEYQRLMKIVEEKRKDKKYKNETTELRNHGRVNKEASDEILETMDEGNNKQKYKSIKDEDAEKRISIATLFAIAVLKPNYGRNKYIEMLIKYNKTGDDNNMLKVKDVKNLFPEPTHRFKDVSKAIGSVFNKKSKSEGTLDTTVNPDSNPIHNRTSRQE